MTKITVSQLNEIGGYYEWIGFINTIIELTRNLHRIEDTELSTKVDSLTDRLDEIKSVLKMKAALQNCEVRIGEHNQ